MWKKQPPVHPIFSLWSKKQRFCENEVKTTSDHAQILGIVIIGGSKQKIYFSKKNLISKKMDFIIWISWKLAVFPHLWAVLYVIYGSGSKIIIFKAALNLWIILETREQGLIIIIYKLVELGLRFSCN